MADFAQAYSDLGWPTEAAAPVVYSTAYNIHFFGIERLHPFDAGKFQKISRALKDKGLLPQVCNLNISPSWASVLKCMSCCAQSTQIGQLPLDCPPSRQPSF